MPVLGWPHLIPYSSFLLPHLEVTFESEFQTEICFAHDEVKNKEENKHSCT